MSDCIFCKIIAREIPADVIYETDDVLVFRDLNAVSPTHVLAIPKKHIGSTNDLQPEDVEVMGNLFLAAKQVALKENISTDGYRMVVNCGEHGGQTVSHIHLHILGGKSFHWPPG